jgi:hypothetical protein
VRRYRTVAMNIKPVRRKARGLDQHGGPPGWLKESDPAGVILYVMVELAFSVPYRLL